MDDTFQLTVSVVHGDLRHAAHPLIVGHYRGDVIVSAEAAIDAALGGALRRRFDLGVYPGPAGTSEIIRAEASPPGAIVIGLGDVGELTPAGLRLAVANATRRYALLVQEDPAQANEPLPRSAGVSSLLVGSDGGTVSVLADCLFAIVRGVLDANRSLRDAGLFDRVRITHLQFVELFEDMAIRAAHLIDDLPAALAQDLRPDERIVSKRVLTTAPGGRFLRPSDPYSGGWWQRIGVRRKTLASASDRPGVSSAAPASSPLTDTATALQFTVLSDRARLEQEVSVGQRALIQQLITSATGRVETDLALSAALYQLVVPDGVQDRISQGRHLVFMVDRAGAAIPFELMAERAVPSPLPLIRERGILRQFETDQFRVRPEMARANRIFIVGNPKTIVWANLPEADAEAEAVKATAEGHGLQALRPTGDGQSIIVALMSGEYRVLHFAAHGQYDPDPMKSGVIVGDRLLLTPAEVARLAVVPELVFLNCCHLGRPGEARPSGPDPRLAASLAEGFIQAGVRAVIAAGWAIHDGAGRTFATTFYDCFFSGDTFGDSVYAARQAALHMHDDVNTWGAYQCYGNPDFRFRVGGKVARRGGSAAPVARSEALQALRTLAGAARGTPRAGTSSVVAEFDRLWNDIIPEWKDGELLNAGAGVLGELQDFPRAIDLYRQAIAAARAGVPVSAVEQLADLLFRNAAARAEQEPPESWPDGVHAAFREAEQWLDWMDDRLPKSKERGAIRGALHKRWAIYASGSRLEHLKKSAAAYRAAAERAGTEAYQRSNALGLQLVLGSRRTRAEAKAKATAYWEEAKQRAQQRREQHHGDLSFWDLVEEPDAFLHKCLADGTLASPPVLTEIKARYARVLQSQPSAREWASVCDHVRFLAVMLKDETLHGHNLAMGAALDDLFSGL